MCIFCFILCLKRCFEIEDIQQKQMLHNFYEAFGNKDLKWIEFLVEMNS